MESKLTDFIFHKMGVPTVQKYLDLGALRQKLISGNISNLSTPGYRAKDIDFQEEFNRLTAKTTHLVGTTTDPNHIPTGAHQARVPDVHKAKVADGDLNSVDIDHETAAQVQNQLAYSVAAKLLQMRFTGLRTAIKSQ